MLKCFDGGDNVSRSWDFCVSHRKNLLPFQVLYFMTLFVYAVISPITQIVIGACFLFMGAMFRSQFIYIYGNRRDSGGKLWAQFIHIIQPCMLIAQLTSKCSSIALKAN